MAKLIGEAVRRVEDRRFITGQGKYTDDIKLPGMTYAYIIRSPYAHARIKRIDTSAAKAMPGVIDVITGEDVKEVNGLPCGWQVNFRNGDTMKEPKHPLLVTDKVRHVGDNVAMVIAETRELAKDAAEKVDIEYEVLKPPETWHLIGKSGIRPKPRKPSGMPMW